MRIIRPYGSSHTKKHDETLRRVLVDNTPEREEHLVPEFALTKAELIIAQWISTIDKIARKPTGDNKPSAEQRAFRDNLGEACWSQLTKGGHLPDANGETREFLRNLWWFKIHPYGPGVEKPRRPDRAPKVKGRWYEVFAGDCDPNQANPTEIAERVERHLYVSEFRLGTRSMPKRRGRIATRAESIEGNFLREPKAPEARKNLPTWTADDIKAYTQPGDPVQAILEEAKALEENNGRMTFPVAAKVLFEHWPKVFRDSAGNVIGDIKRAREQCPGMFALHGQLKQCYRHLLKRTRKDTREHRKRDRNERMLSTLLPNTLEQALWLSRMQDANAELAGLVRLGKIIYYTASDGGVDQTKIVTEQWPDYVADSRFWQSSGQAEIKRAEAFVRIWRHVLVLAGLTLKDWLSFRDDVLGRKREHNKDLTAAIEALRTDRDKSGQFERKLLLLFGNRVDLLGLQSVDDCIKFLCGLIDGAANLRHAAFHFKGRGQLLNELAKLPEYFSGPPKLAIERLWEKDVADRTDRLRAVLIGAHAEQFLRPEQAAQVFLLLDQDSVELPLPRFSRVLERKKSSWEQAIRLPEPPNRRKLEEAPARHCQYALLKLTYERPFRAWLTEQGANAISGWIERAVARASEAAKADADDVGRKVIAARAAHLPKPQAGSDIRDFFFTLSAETASEMRVQRGYQSDAKKAREQAEYIEHLLCDVMVLSFEAYLSQNGLGWLLDLRPDQAPSEAPTCSLANIEAPRRDRTTEVWQSSLYVILHLMPVESVGQLLHQLFKWEIAAGRDTELCDDERERLKHLVTTLTLYLDMHDAKFEGGTTLVGCQEFRELFESEAGFHRVFPKDPKDFTAEADRRIPRRGLREIMRFGHLPLIKTINGENRIRDEMINDVFAMETSQDGAQSQIAALQQRREDLHAIWVQSKDRDPAKKPFGEGELQEYCEVLAKIAKHREESNFVNLVDHVRIHRLIMTILARLVDYSGLFERDLYFATLALLHQRKLHPGDLLNEKGLKYLRTGQIISALREHKNGSMDGVLNALAAHFGVVWEDKSPLAKIRNQLAHVDLWEGDIIAPRLAKKVNQTRQLVSYDRKLKNAVSKSVIELVEREGIDLRWKIKSEGQVHDLTDAELYSRCAVHLGGKKVKLRGADVRDKWKFIDERLHSDSYVKMIAAAFNGVHVHRKSIIEIVNKIDWKASTAVKGREKFGGEAGAHPPPSGRKKWRVRNKKRNSAVRAK